MDLNQWFTENYDDIVLTTKNITKGDPLWEELLSDVLTQMLEKPEKLQQVPPQNRKYYLIKVLKNNWNSSTSPFRYQRIKHQNKHVPFEVERNDYSDEEPELRPTMDWVNKQLQDFDWFERDLFLLWIEMGTLIKVHEETTIPLNSIGTYIRKIKDELNTRWVNEINRQ